MKTIYDIFADPDLVSMQKASLSSESYGLKITHGLIGSQEWRDNLSAGRIATNTVLGTVSNLWLGRAGDYPEFEVIDHLGESTRWICSLDRNAAAIELVKGTRVKIEYVLQEWKTPFDGRTDTKITMAIYVAD